MALIYCTCVIFLTCCHEITFMSILRAIAFGWMVQGITDDKSTLVQVMASYHEATTHCLSQCWPRSVLPYGIARLQWVKHVGNVSESGFRFNKYVVIIVSFTLQFQICNLFIVECWFNGTDCTPEKNYEKGPYCFNGPGTGNYVLK